MVFLLIRVLNDIEEVTSSDALNNILKRSFFLLFQANASSLAPLNTGVAHRVERIIPEEWEV